MLNKIKILFIILLSGILISAVTENPLIAKKSKKELWVDSVFSTLSLDQKIGQLFMIRAHSDKNQEYYEKVANQIRNYQVGGVCFFQGGPLRQIELVNYYQSISKVPLMVGIDGEWGPAMRIDSILSFPRQMTLGAIDDNRFIYDMGARIATQCKNLGITINFAPVVDVNVNPNNPVINSRSFGENQQVVTEKSIMYMNGMQMNGVLACAKHFPGHGDTDSDSHKTLPFFSASLDTLEKIHLFPFKNLIENGVASVMVAHLFIPALDTNYGRASSLSPFIINDLLKSKLNFKGLVFTDALEMKGVAANFPPGTIEVKALQAGVDILLMPNDLQKAVDSIKVALDSGLLQMEEIDSKVKKILSYKYDCLPITNKVLSVETVKKEAYNSTDSVLIQQLYDKAITVIKNKHSILPISQDSNKKFAFLTIGRDTNNTLSLLAKNFRKFDLFSLADKESQENIQKMADTLTSYDYLVINLINTNQLEKNDYNIQASTFNFLKSINGKTKCVLHLAGNPYILRKILDSIQADAILLSYDDNEFTFRSAANAMFGKMEITGKLPVSINDQFKSGFGIEFKSNTIRIGTPESIGIKSKKLSQIDTLVQSGIDQHAYPGAQVLIAKDGVIFYNKSFGKPAYNSSEKVSNESIYDLASVTKILSTTLAVMKLYEEGKLNLDLNLGYYLPELKGSNKENLIIRDVLAHQAGLKPWIPFYEKTIINGNLNENIFRQSQSDSFPIQLAENIFVRYDYKDSVLKAIYDSELLPTNTYKYSDLGMYLMKEIVERIVQKSIDRYNLENFYIPMGLHYTGFNPLLRFPKKQIIPTENDLRFRKQQIHGYVHDPGAALMGGIGGHAGLFSNASDVAIILQMFIQKGNYGGKQYLKESTIAEFTKQQFPLNNNRRGLGFDKPLLNHEKGGPSSHLASQNSYGHSGFTGTLVWVDPDNGLIYIFLSNRVYPDASNAKLGDLSIRTKIHDIIYKAL